MDFAVNCDGYWSRASQDVCHFQLIGFLGRKCQLSRDWFLLRSQHRPLHFLLKQARVEKNWPPIKELEIIWFSSELDNCLPIIRHWPKSRCNFFKIDLIIFGERWLKSKIYPDSWLTILLQFRFPMHQYWWFSQMHIFYWTSVGLNWLSVETSWGFSFRVLPQLGMAAEAGMSLGDLFQPIWILGWEPIISECWLRELGMVRKRSWNATLELRWETWMGWSGICLFIKLTI